MKAFGFPIVVVATLSVLAIIFPTVVYIPLAMPALFFLAGVILASTFPHTRKLIKLALCTMALLAFTAFALAGHDSTGVLTGALLLAWVAFFTGFGGIYLFNAFRYREASE